MSTPGEYYRSLPPVVKAYGVICLMTTSSYYLQLIDPYNLALEYKSVLKQLQIWRLITNFFFLGPFSLPFAVRLLMLARYGVLLEKGPFDKRTADFLWMMIFGALSLLVIAAVPLMWSPFMGISLVFMLVYVWSREFPNARISIYGIVTLKVIAAVPLMWSPFMGISLVFMLVYVWSREFPNARISIYGIVTLKGFYLPWAMLALDLIFGNRLMPDILGMVVGHLYYFLTVLHPLAGGRDILKTPLWVHKLVAFWGKGTQINSPVQPNPSAGVAFRGRSYRLSDRQGAQINSPVQPNPSAGGAFSGRGHRLGDR